MCGKMKKLSLLALLLLVGSVVAAKGVPTLFAHRGCWSKSSSGEFIIPENSVAAVAMAARMGYAGIECDVKKTKDGKLVVFTTIVSIARCAMRLTTQRLRARCA